MSTKNRQPRWKSWMGFAAIALMMLCAVVSGDPWFLIIGCVQGLIIAAAYVDSDDQFHEMADLCDEAIDCGKEALAGWAKTEASK